MQLNYNNNAPKKHVNLTANTELLAMVRKEKGNLSAIFERSMIEYIAEREMERWKEVSQASFDSYNRMIEERGTLADDIGFQL